MKYSDILSDAHTRKKKYICILYYTTKITFAEGGRRQARQSLREAMIKHVNMLYIWLMRRRRAEKCERESMMHLVTCIDESSFQTLGYILRRIYKFQLLARSKTYQNESADH